MRALGADVARNLIAKFSGGRSRAFGVGENVRVVERESLKKGLGGDEVELAFAGEACHHRGAQHHIGHFFTKLFYGIGECTDTGQKQCIRLFHFTYVGALYLGERDIGPVFKAIKELIEEGAVKKKNIVYLRSNRNKRGRFRNFKYR